MLPGHDRLEDAVSAFERLAGSATEQALLTFQPIAVGHRFKLHAYGVGDRDDRASFECEGGRTSNRTYALPAGRHNSYEKLYELPFFGMLKKGKNFRKRTNPFYKRWAGSLLYFGADIAAFLALYCNYKRGRKQGDIFIDYSAPIPIGNLVDIQANFSPQSKDEFFAHKNSIQLLGEAVRGKLLELYRLLPMHIVSYSIKHQPSNLIEELQKSLRATIVGLSGLRRNTSLLEPLSDEQILAAGIKQLSVFKAVAIRENRVTITNPSIIDYFAAAVC